MHDRGPAHEERESAGKHSGSHQLHAEAQYSPEYGDPHTAYHAQRSPSPMRQLETATSFLPVAWDTNDQHLQGGISQGRGTQILAGNGSPTHLSQRADQLSYPSSQSAPWPGRSPPSLTIPSPREPRPVMPQQPQQHLSYDPPPPREQQHTRTQSPVPTQQHGPKLQRFQSQQQAQQQQQQQQRLMNASPPTQTAAKPSALWRTQPNQQPPPTLPGLPSPISATQLASQSTLPAPRPYAIDDVPSPAYANHQLYRPAVQQPSASSAAAGRPSVGNPNSSDSPAGGGGASAWASYVSGYGPRLAEGGDSHRSPLNPAGGGGGQQQQSGSAWPSREQQYQRDQGRAGSRAAAGGPDEEAQVGVRVCVFCRRRLGCCLFYSF